MLHLEFDGTPSYSTYMYLQDKISFFLKLTLKTKKKKDFWLSNWRKSRPLQQML